MKKLLKLLIAVSVLLAIASIIGFVSAFCYSNASSLYWQCIRDPTLEAEADYYYDLGNFFKMIMLDIYLPIAFPIIIIGIALFLFRDELKKFINKVRM